MKEACVSSSPWGSPYSGHVPSTLSNLEDSASDPESFSFEPLALV